MKFIDLSGLKFGRLLVISREGSRSNRPLWKCLCDCGNIAYVIRDNLHGSTKSCGCLNKELVVTKNTKHGYAQNQNKKTKTYRAWSNMIQRCYNKNNKMYKYYGGRGIVVCDSWRDNFLNFLHDMGISPEKLELDRIDTNGNYEPINCRWVTREINNNNRRCTKSKQNIGG